MFVRDVKANCNSTHTPPCSKQPQTKAVAELLPVPQGLERGLSSQPPGSVPTGVILPGHGGGGGREREGGRDRKTFRGRE